VDLTCYQGDIELDSDIFSGVSAPILLYLPEHAVTVSVAATIPSNFEICGGPGASISGGSLTNNAGACFNGFAPSATPGGADGTVQYNNAGTFGGILNSFVDPITGDLTLGANFGVNVATASATIFLNANDNAGHGALTIATGNLVFINVGGDGGGFFVDTTTDGGSNPGTGIIQLTSAGGIQERAIQGDAAFAASGPLSAAILAGYSSQIAASNDLFYVRVNISAPQFDIISLDQGSQTFTISGDWSLNTPLLTTFAVVNSTGNDGTYTVSGVSVASGNTVFAVNEAIPDATADGSITTTPENLGIFKVNAGMTVDATAGGGTQPINFMSAGGVSMIDNSPAGILITQSSGVITLTATTDGSVITLQSTGVGGSVALAGTGGIQLAGAASLFDVDQTVSGVITVSTILNAIGGFQANGVAGISEVCTVAPTGITISFGIITAISGGTCTP
jgi:hypothetical protein